MERNENYFVWLFNQLRGGQCKLSAVLFCTGLSTGALLISSPITSVTLITFVGTILGTLCVLAINATKAINGWLGLISAACFIYAGLAAKNYLSIFEQIAYVLTLDLPVIFAVRSWNDDTKNHLRRFGAKQWIVAIIGTLLVYVISGYLIGNLTNDPRPWIDAISFAISLTAGIMCFMRYNNQYYWWLASGNLPTDSLGCYLCSRGCHAGNGHQQLDHVVNDILPLRFRHGSTVVGVRLV